MMKPMKLCVLAIASIALITSSVRAATVTAAQGDLILGFRATSGTGAGWNLEVNLGSVSNYYGATPNSTFAVPQLALQDIADTYGADWATRSGLYWGLAATYSNAASDPNGKPAATLWVTDVSGDLPLRASFDGQAAPGGAIQVLYTGGTGSLNGKNSTTNSNFAAVIDKTQTGSWGNKITTGNSFGFFSPKIDVLTSSTDKTLDLVELQPYDGDPKPAGTKLGTFTLTSGGLEFQAIPEPSTWMLVGCGLGMMAMVNRFRKPRRA